MINRIRTIFSKETSPYANLALEEALLQNVSSDECILYLWQNQRTVVIGRNQNAWKECNITALENDGGNLARRLSGGGAVFHDLGNLNFTFLAHDCAYNVYRQLDVILRAVKKLGIDAERTGRNDIIVDGRKFSGNAFYKTGARCYHHGTILVNVNMEDMTKYLNVSAEKLKSNGVDSVKSRVVNLADLKRDITVESVRRALVEAFGEIYGLTPAEIPEHELDVEQIEALTEKYKSWDWNKGKKMAFETEICHRFDWGEIQIQLKIDGGKVTDARVYSDAMHTDFIARIPPMFIGAPFTGEFLAASVAFMSSGGQEGNRIRLDLADYLQHNV